MAIRIRKVEDKKTTGGFHYVALCAAETKAEPGDIYLDDSVHHALSGKFYADHVKIGFIKKEPNFNELVKKLKSFMAKKNLTIGEISVLIEKDPKTIWQFLHQRVNPHDRTIYKIKKLLGEH